MGAFDQIIPNIIVPNDDTDPQAAAAFRKKWGWEPYEIVILRGVLTAGDTEALTNASVSMGEDGRSPVASAGTGQTLLLVRLITDWTLRMGAQKAPITLENVRRLPGNYVTPLLEISNRLSLGMTQNEQKDFFSSVNGHTSENSGEMKPSLFPS